MRKGWEDFAGEEKSGDKSLGEVKGFPAGEDEAESTPPVTVWARKLSASEAPRKGALSRLGRELLFLGVRRRFGLELREEDLSRGAYGKPFVKDRPDIQFNISHSGEYAACALTRVPCGLDIQEIRGFRGKRILERTMDEEQQRQILSSADPALAFSRLWAEKESIVKLSGEGLSRSFRDLKPPVWRETFEQLPAYTGSICAGVPCWISVEEVLPQRLWQALAREK